MIFVFAPGAGSRPLPKAVAVILMVCSPGLLYVAYDMAFVPAVRRVLACTRTPDAVVCQPGDLRGARARVARQSGRGARDCFVLEGDSRWQCTSTEGAAAAGVAKVNALAVGGSTEVDVTEQKVRWFALLPLFAGVSLLISGVRRLRQ